MNYRIARVVTLLLVVYPLSTSSRLFAKCGVERWPIKTGADAGAQQIDLANPKPTTIAELVQLQPPQPIPPNQRVAPTETTVWVVNATLTDYKHESGRTGDNDYHLVLDDGQGHTMVAEIPSPDCVDDASPFAAQIAGARTTFDSQLTASPAFQTANIPVQVTGVGMFDFAHGQHGAAPNEIELHPVLAIVFNPSTPAPDAGTDFALAVPSSTVHLIQGGSSTVTVSASSGAASAPNVKFSATGLPTGVTAHVTQLGAAKATVTLQASAAVSTGSFPFTVTGTASGKSHSMPATLNISSTAQPVPAGQQWDYEIVTAASDQEMLNKANQLGTDDWEMVGIVHQGTTGWKAFFKRPKRDF